ncbi:aefe04ff-b57a-4585-9e5f-c04e24442a3a [Sclerotinia trifoliorum]|uniref:Aefe04ff-b57a-4585-9e5f-c04e24442a3a n=1 Tax=Sclerotinia trifoliorum TaxID=28548 RepID=A0A8H2VRD5_9HELO|nr:aefe04ff-b57a-4585-9e5f-c04e24442a3a [Sclerotinia trifoliorum]
MSKLTDSGIAWLATTVPLLFMCMLAVIFHVAWKRGRSNKADVGILIALGFVIAHEIVGCVGIFTWGLDHDVCFYILQIIYQTTIATIQISLLFFYISFPLTSNLKPIYHITTLSIFLSMIAFDTATLFQCTPIPYIWDRTIAHGQCINKSALSITHAITNIFFHFLLFILSLPILHSLHLSRNQKYAISSIYLLGCAIFTTSILNLTPLISISTPISPTPKVINNPNPQTLLTHSLEPSSLIFLTLLTTRTPQNPPPPPPAAPSTSPASPVTPPGKPSNLALHPSNRAPRLNPSLPSPSPSIPNMCIPRLCNWILVFVMK